MPIPDVAAALLLSKGDIATLAKVRRPVVSVWARRYPGPDRPFPKPAQTDGNRELFRGAEVVEWLIARGLGNSSTLREDLAVHAVLKSGSGLPARTVFDGITALLCVKVAVDEQLGELDPEALLDEVDELDPDDDYCFAEVRALGGELAAFAAYTDMICDAAYTPAAAFESLMAQRFRLGLSDLADTAIEAEGLGLCVQVCHALVHPGEVDDVLFVDPTAGSSDLLVALLPALPEIAHPAAMIAETGSNAARLARRRLATHCWGRARPPAAGLGGDFTIDRPAVFLTQYPAPGAIGLGDRQILDAIENVVLQMGPRHHGVVIGPASALIAPLDDAAAEAVRDGVLRSDRLRAAIRLPEGLLTTRPGLPMALWVLGAADPSIKTADRWTVLADLSAVAINASTTGAVVADVMAAMGSWDSVRAHAFHHGGIYRTAEILVEGALTPPRARAQARRGAPRGPQLAGAVLALVDTVNAEAAPGHLTLPVEYRDDEGPAPAPVLASAGELAERRMLKVLAGNKIDRADLDTRRDRGTGNVQVIGPEEVLGGPGPGTVDGRTIDRLTIDRLTLTAKYPNSRLTEPGDIVFCASPEFGVLVDQHGASVVLAPARVLRLAGPPSRTGLIPRLVAAHLKADHLAGVGSRPAGAIRSGRSWRQWEIPQLPPGPAEAARRALEDLAGRREAAAAALARIDALTSTLAGGLARGALTLPTN